MGTESVFEVIHAVLSAEPISVEQVASPEAILDARRRIAELYMDERIVDYIVEIVHATRKPAEAVG